MLSPHQLHATAQFFQSQNIDLVDLIVTLAENSKVASMDGIHSQLYTSLCVPKSLNKIFAAFLHNPATVGYIQRIARNIATNCFIRELSRIVEKPQGFHFNASHMTSDKLCQFSRSRMAENMERQCPYLWRLFQLLLNVPLAQKAVARLEACRDYFTELAPAESGSKSTVRDINFSSQSEDTWYIDVRTSQGHRVESTDAQGRRIELAIVHCVSIFSIFMQNINTKCNGLQTLVSLFAHSTHTPESVLEVLAHAGIGLSPSSINSMVHSMSENAIEKLKNLLLSEEPQAIAYDNLDIDFKTEQPTADYSGNLAHITTGTFIPLQGATKEDLRVLQEMWQKSVNNPDRDQIEPVIRPTHKNLMRLIQSSGLGPAEHPLSVQSCLAWHICSFLLLNDVDTILPDIKDKLKHHLGSPAPKKLIPVVKTIQHPARAMNISVSTNL